MTDRGAQFTGKNFYGMMRDLSVLHSMSRPHKPVDNRFIEFWKSMKVELGKTCLLTEQTYQMVVDYYIYYYNNLRPHSTLDYRTPSLHSCHYFSKVFVQNLAPLSAYTGVAIRSPDACRAFLL